MGKSSEGQGRSPARQRLHRERERALAAARHGGLGAVGVRRGGAEGPGGRRDSLRLSWRRVLLPPPRRRSPPGFHVEAGERFEEAKEEETGLRRPPRPIHGPAHRGRRPQVREGALQRRDPELDGCLRDDGHRELDRPHGKRCACACACACSPRMSSSAPQAPPPSSLAPHSPRTD